VIAAHYKTDDLLNYWTGSSDISGYHANFNEVHGAVGAGQGRGTAWQGNGMGTAWARRVMCESAFRLRDQWDRGISVTYVIKNIFSCKYQSNKSENK
jgi:hypothetical protein